MKGLRQCRHFACMGVMGVIFCDFVRMSFMNDPLSIRQRTIKPQIVLAILSYHNIVNV